MTRPRLEREEAANATLFDEVPTLIDAARRRACQGVNPQPVGLYWEVGEYISRKIRTVGWDEGVVDQLATAAVIARKPPGLRGFTRRDLFRKLQFFDSYGGDEKVSPLVRQLPWSHHAPLECRRLSGGGP